MTAKEVAVSIVETVVGAILLVGSWIDWAFTEYLLLSNIISAGLLLALGDFTVQTLEMVLSTRRPGHRYDPVRNARTLVVGFVLGVFNHYWYAILEHFLHGHTLDIVLKKIAWDQAIAGPFFSSAFLVGMGVMEGRTAADIYKEWSEKFLSIYKADWVFWPAAQFVNFYLVPHRFRVFYVNLATFLWNTFLCYMKHAGNSPRRCRTRAGSRYGRSLPTSRRSRSESPSCQGDDRPRMGRRPCIRPRMRLTKITHTHDKRSSGRLKMLEAPEKERSSAQAAGDPDITIKRIRKYMRKKKKKRMERGESSQTDLRKEKGHLKRKSTSNKSNKMATELTELHQLLHELCNQMSTNQAVLEKYLLHTCVDIAQLHSMCNYLHCTIEETRRGAINIALQITQMVKEERQQCTKDVRQTMADMMVKLELLLPEHGEEDRTVSLP